jgi:hypothetical protein
MDKPTKQISRRDAMKLLGAAAGASALANLPGKWHTPELTAGVLPAHAQTSVGARVIKSCVPISTGPISADGPSPSMDPPVFTLTSEVQISPGDTGVSMHYKNVLTNLTSPDPLEGDVPTTLGLASVTFHVTPSGGVASAVVTWTFTSLADGTGSCDVHFDD